ncbi:DNA transformation protein [Paucibacter oligotrophus]|uniref:DNA transformation protein n=1 Tax=Roseateles oligotrophus TaxID=1769250 RepID=A0A840LJY2_9BURK|nr:TfoX/Sxy family protein [Roseateles oligotrophus]MBB4845597.1 DNA transformation protein [Roseateles oligotrophus]
MNAKDEFTRHCAELLEGLGPVRTRRMFGGHGVYVDDLFVAIIIDEQLYLKTDAQSRPQFEAQGCQPFRYQREGETHSLGYYRPPEEAIDSPALLRPWARLAQEAALRAQAAKLAKPVKKQQPGKAASVKRPAGGSSRAPAAASSSARTKARTKS